MVRTTAFIRKQGAQVALTCRRRASAKIKLLEQRLALCPLGHSAMVRLSPVQRPKAWRLSTGRN